MLTDRAYGCSTANVDKGLYVLAAPAVIQQRLNDGSLYGSPPPFEMSINPCAFYEAELAKAKAKDPELDETEMRWNSGYFQYPACIGLGAEVSAISTSLNNMVDAGTVTGEEVREGMFAICCAAMAELARAGLFGDTSAIDFLVMNANDSWYEDKLKTVRDRDAAIRRLIAAI